MSIKDDIEQADRILERLKAEQGIKEDTKNGLIESIEIYRKNLIERNKTNEDLRKSKPKKP